MQKKNLNAAVSTSLCVVLSWACTGCSAFRSHTQTIKIKCDPTDATLTVNGQNYSPPAKVRVTRNEDVFIRCSKEGFESYEREIGRHLNTTGKIDAVAAWVLLFPAIGLWTPGAYSLDETDVSISLFPK